MSKQLCKRFCTAALLMITGIAAAMDNFDVLTDPNLGPDSIYLPNPGLLPGIRPLDSSSKHSFTPFQLTFWPAPYAHLFSTADVVAGINIGCVVTTQREICGLNVAPLQVLCIRQYGIACNLFSQVFDNHALVFAAASYVTLNNGVQIGMYNHSSDAVVYQRPDGKMVSRKIPDSKVWGVQIGVINVSETPGWQLGLINYCPYALVKCMPLFNFYTRL